MTPRQLGSTAIALLRRARARRPAHRRRVWLHAITTHAAATLVDESLFLDLVDELLKLAGDPRDIEALCSLDYRDLVDARAP